MQTGYNIGYMQVQLPSIICLINCYGLNAIINHHQFFVSITNHSWQKFSLQAGWAFPQWWNGWKVLSPIRVRAEPLLLHIKTNQVMPHGHLPREVLWTCPPEESEEDPGNYLGTTLESLQDSWKRELCKDMSVPSCTCCWLSNQTPEQVAGNNRKYGTQ